VIFVAVLLALGVASTWFLWKSTFRRLSEDAMEQAQMVARSINPGRLELL